MIKFNSEDRIWITSDWHFNHDREFIYKARGFNTITEMNNAIVERHNSIVKENDIVIVLGDICLGGSSEEIIEDNKSLIESLNGNIYIINGNHDTEKRINMYRTCKNVAYVDEYSEMLTYNGYHFYLSHFPTLTGNLEKESLKQMTLNLYGHTHQKSNFYEGRPYMYHCGVDSHDCYPVSLNKIIVEMHNEVNNCIKQL